MKKTKNARPDVGASRQAAEQGVASRQTTDSNSKFNRDRDKLQDGIAGFLLPGQENAIPLRDLVALTGRSGRIVRKMIEQERRAGVLILSDNQTGYYLAGDARETALFVRSMRGRAREILRTAQAIERSAGLD